MKNVIRFVGLIGLLFPLASHAFYYAHDKWTGEDKREHYFGGTTGGALGASLIRQFTSDEDTILIGGAFLGQFPGLIREIGQGDSKIHGFSFRDHFFNITGALTGAYFSKTMQFSPHINEHGNTDGFMLKYQRKF